MMSDDETRCAHCDERIVQRPCTVRTASLVALLDAALVAITLADSLDQARGLAHAALHREEYLAVSGDERSATDEPGGK